MTGRFQAGRGGATLDKLLCEKFVLGRPAHCIVAALTHDGLALAEGTLVGVFAACAELLAPLAGLISDRNATAAHPTMMSTSDNSCRSHIFGCTRQHRSRGCAPHGAWRAVSAFTLSVLDPWLCAQPRIVPTSRCPMERLSGSEMFRSVFQGRTRMREVRDRKGA